MSDTTYFERAVPVWLAGKSHEMNITAGFRAVVEGNAEDAILRITGSSLYRIWLNGSFLGHGPARCGHGYYRVEEWDLGKLFQKGKNLIAVEAAGYNVNGYYLLDQPPFVQAEVVSDNQVIAATGEDFDALLLTERVQKVQRYSFQRAFAEVYRLQPDYADWREDVAAGYDKAEIEEQEKKKLVARGTPYPQFKLLNPVTLCSRGTIAIQTPAEIHQNRAWDNINPGFKGYRRDELEVELSEETRSLNCSVRDTDVRQYHPDNALNLTEETFEVCDLHTNLTGLIGMKVSCKTPITLYCVFDELITEDGDVDFLRLGALSSIKYELQPGSYCLETIEPYTFQYLKIMAVKGDCSVREIYLREYVSPEADKATFSCSDAGLEELFEAARQTFKQNSVDIFMDCPSRERAGWLCDSFFTAQAETVLCGGNPIEHDFLENFLLPSSFPHLPEGMFPMCYPADHPGDSSIPDWAGRFIPNWAMWFVIELEDYLGRTGDTAMVAQLKSKVYALLKYFKDFLNSDGLLEKLESWVFIEWSRANEFVQDVSYPSNMLYAGMLDAAGRLYDEPDLNRQAETVRATIRKQSFNGDFFVDNAIRQDDGSLVVTENTSETCQYYAFYFKVATADTYQDLWKKLLSDFGPTRDPEKQYPEVFPSNAFIGFFLRLGILSRAREVGLILEQLKLNYLPMAQRTGTLWENKNTVASCNHGFASFVACILINDILGCSIDYESKQVTLRVPDIGLENCSARIPVGDEWIEASWQKQGDVFTHELQVPEGYTATRD